MDKFKNFLITSFNTCVILCKQNPVEAAMIGIFFLGLVIGLVL